MLLQGVVHLVKPGELLEACNTWHLMALMFTTLRFQLVAHTHYRCVTSCPSLVSAVADHTAFGLSRNKQRP